MILIAIIGRLAKKYNPYVEEADYKTTAIVPIYNENPILLDRCLKSIRSQVDQLITVLDHPNEELINISNRYSNKTLIRKNERGKRSAIYLALNFVENPIIVLVDSDVEVIENSIKELIKPFKEPYIGIVQGHPIIPLNNEDHQIKNKHLHTYVNVYSSLIEQCRDVTCRALNKHLIVADGRLQAIRTNLFNRIKDEWVYEKWFKKQSSIGDDRSRTRLIHKLGYSSVYQSTAICYTIAPKDFKSMIYQQLRWFRSGWKYFLKDIKELNMPTVLYTAKSFFYYLSPAVLCSIILIDLFYYPKLNFLYIPPYLIPIMSLVSISIITLLRQSLYLGFRNVKKRYITLFAVTGLFIMIPISFYALLTIWKQDKWMTR